MGKRKRRKHTSKAGKRMPKSKPVDAVTGIEADELVKRERQFEFFVIGVLLVFGIYQSVLYFGHKVVPISDFPDIVKVGHDLLSFRLPARFKQAPVAGLLQASLSYLVGGQHPDLTAGWLLNAILHPLNLVLFYLVGKQIVGRAAIWFALIAILNRWVLYMLTEPIMETTLLFFLLLTFYLIFKRSNLCYVSASIATMVRYEGAALILTAFVMDMICRKDKRERLRAFLYSGLALIPLALWMLGTVSTWEPGTSHYLNVLFTKKYADAFSGSVEGRTGIGLHMRLLWTVGFRPLFVLITAAKANFVRLTASEIESMKAFFSASQIIALVSFAFGAIYGLCKRQWRILVLLLFFVPYFLLHAFYPYPLQRFHTTIFWIAVLLSIFGLQSAWQLVDRNGRLPRPIVLMLQGFVILISVVWFVSLISYLSKMAPASPKSASLPWVAMVVAGLILAGRIYIHRARYIVRELSILALMCLIIASNHFTVVRLLGDGKKDQEFKQLADWYIDNAKPGEKLGVYMAGVVKMFAPKYADYIVRLPQADSPSEFVEACYKEDITYVVWATREGLSNQHTGYNRLGLDENIAHLCTPKDVGPYKFVAQVGSSRRYVNVFRLLRPAELEGSSPDG